MSQSINSSSSWITDSFYWKGQEQNRSLLQKMGHYNVSDPHNTGECSLVNPNCTHCYYKQTVNNHKKTIDEKNEHMIRERAYCIWQKTGNNDAQANWFQALNELVKEGVMSDTECII